MFKLYYLYCLFLLTAKRTNFPFLFFSKHIVLRHRPFLFLGLESKPVIVFNIFTNIRNRWFLFKSIPSTKINHYFFFLICHIDRDCIRSGYGVTGKYFLSRFHIFLTGSDLTRTRGAFIALSDSRFLIFRCADGVSSSSGSWVLGMRSLNL